MLWEMIKILIIYVNGWGGWKIEGIKEKLWDF